MTVLTAWISIGSTYTYLTAARLRRMITQHDIDITFKPFSVRQIMKNMNNIPFPPEKKQKVVHMWRDIERRAQFYDIPAPKVPAPYPLTAFDRANRVGIVANQEGWYLDYLEHTYHEWFVKGLPAGDQSNLSTVCSELGQDMDRVIAASDSETVQSTYHKTTEEAAALGVFGAPSFSVGSEIFWGDDRLEDAIRWQKDH